MRGGGLLPLHVTTPVPVTLPRLFVESQSFASPRKVPLSPLMVRAPAVSKRTAHSPLGHEEGNTWPLKVAVCAVILRTESGVQPLWLAWRSLAPR